MDSLSPSPGVRPNFEVVLVEPEIPNNTGNIGRTTAATGCRLHLVHPLGFDLDDKAVKRAGLDYWPLVDLHEHPDWASCDAAVPGPGWLLSRHAGRTIWDADFQRGDRLVFGKESAGVGESFRESFAERWGPDRLLRLPMVERPGIRSLNLSNSVAVTIFEGLRQLGGVETPH